MRNLQTRLPLLFVVCLGLGGFTATNAQAATAQFAHFGTGAGELSDPKTVAVDQSSGMVFVADQENKRVDVFDESGGFVRAFGFGVVDGAAKLEVCTTVTGCREGLTGEEPGEAHPYSVAVGPEGDVYVADEGKHRVEKFTEAGEFLLMFGKEVNKTTGGDVCTEADVQAHDVCGDGASGSEPGELEQGSFPIAIDGTGDLWVGDVNRLEEFRAGGEFAKEVSLPMTGSVQALAVEPEPKNGLYVIGESGGVQKVGELGSSVGPPYPLDAGGEPRALSLDPATGTLFVLDGREAAARVLEYNTAGTQLEAFGAGEVIGHPEANALVFGNKASSLYLVSSASGERGQTGESAAQAFSPPPAGPLVEPVGSTGASGIGKTSATLEAKVDPEGAVTTVRFEYVDDARFKAEGEWSGPHVTETPPAALAGAGFAIEPASITIAPGSLTPGTLYHVRVLAHNTNGERIGEEATFKTLPSARIESTSVTEVTSISAVLDAQIDPLGDATTYRFEYISEASYLANGESFEGTSPATNVPELEVSIGSGTNPVEVAPEPISGLTPGTVYRYRVVARNEHESKEYTEDGPQQSFTTHTAGQFALPDGRQWEMVSPPEKNGALIEPIGEYGVIQAAASGDALTYHANQAFESQPAGATSQVQALSTRGTQGWSTSNIEVPHVGPSDEYGIGGQGPQYRFFSEDLSRAVVQPAGAFDPALSPEASEQTAFLRTDFLDESIAEPCTATAGRSCYRPLVTGSEGYANVPPGTVFGHASGVGNANGAACPEAGPYCGPQLAGASRDGAHVVVESPAQLTSVATPADQEELYEWSASKLALVSLLPGAGGPATGGLTLGFGISDAHQDRHAVSDDGTRVFWSIGGEKSHLYMRDLTHGSTVLQSGEAIPGETLQLDAGAKGGGATEPGAKFQLAASDGSQVLFTDGQRLTGDSGGTSEKQDLYECEIVEGAGEKLECKLTDLTPVTGAGESANVQGAVVGESESGCDVGSVGECYVYFVATGRLATAAVAGMDNMYVRHDGVTSLVAVLSSEDAPDWAKGGTAQTLSHLTARVSPNGRWLAFMSDRDLTGYDSSDAVSGKPDEEVYLYDAGSNGAGSLTCTSCDPTGARPVGEEYTLKGKLVGGNRVWEPSSWLAANVPGWTPTTSDFAQYQSRYLSNTGRLFFNSHDALVPRDVNGQWDVYEYEPEGTASPEGKVQCSEGTSSGGDVFKPAYTAEVEGRKVEEGAGCVGLISSGSSAEESAFLDASESGGDVFFLTTAKLESQDFDNAFDIYDAHECTTLSPCIPPPGQSPPPCETAEACRGTQSPQPGIFGQPPSATFNGQGNLTPAPKPVVVKPTAAQLRAKKLAAALKACKRDKRKAKRVACEKAVRGKYGPVTKAKKRK